MKTWKLKAISKRILPGEAEGCSSLINWSNFFDSFFFIKFLDSLASYSSLSNSLIAYFCFTIFTGADWCHLHHENHRENCAEPKSHCENQLCCLKLQYSVKVSSVE